MKKINQILGTFLIVVVSASAFAGSDNFKRCGCEITSDRHSGYVRAVKSLEDRAPLTKFMAHSIESNEALYKACRKVLDTTKLCRGSYFVAFRLKEDNSSDSQERYSCLNKGTALIENLVLVRLVSGSFKLVSSQNLFYSLPGEELEAQEQFVFQNDQGENKIEVNLASDNDCELRSLIHQVPL